MHCPIRAFAHDELGGGLTAIDHGGDPDLVALPLLPLAEHAGAELPGLTTAERPGSVFVEVEFVHDAVHERRQQNRRGSDK